MGTTNNTNYSYHGDVNSARLKTVTAPTVKNPLAFIDPVDRQAATLGRIQRIMDDPKYKALGPKGQEKLRSRYYDKYVVPSYQGAGFPIPDKDTWVKSVAKRNSLTGGFEFGPESYYDGKNVRSINEVGFAAAKSVGDIMHGSLTAGVWIGKQATLRTLGLSHFFQGTSPEESQSDRTKVEQQFKYAQKVVNKISQGVIQDSNFWMQTHPSKSFVDKADSFVGEQLVQLPFYIALGEARALSAPKNLTKALATAKPAAQVMAKALGAAADGFMGSVLQGRSKEETISDMASFAGFTVAGSAVGAIAGSSLMKKLIAHVVSTGGKPLAEALQNEAIHEIENGMIHGQKAPDNVKAEHVMQALNKAHQDDPIKTKLVTSYKAIVNSIAQSNFGKSFKDLSVTEKAKVRQFHAELTQDAIREIPVHLPEISKASAQAVVSEARQLDPKMAAWDKAMEAKHGINMIDALHQAELEQVKQQTGIKSTQAVAKKISKTKSMKPAKANFPQAVSLADILTQTLQKETDPKTALKQALEGYGQSTKSRRKIVQENEDLKDFEY